MSFIDSFQFLSSPLDSSVENLNKDGFKYFSQGFDNNVLVLVKQKRFYPYEYMSDFEKFKEKLVRKNFIVSQLIEKLVARNINNLLMLGKKLK